MLHDRLARPWSEEEFHAMTAPRTQRVRQFAPTSLMAGPLADEADDSDDAGSLQPVVVPELEHQEGPEGLAMVADGPTGARRCGGRPPRGGRVPGARAGRGPGAASTSGASGPRSQAATGMPKPFLGRARIDAGSRLAAARLSSRLVWLRPNLNDGGRAWMKSTSSASRNGARTSSPQAMLARSTLVRMSSGRYVSW